MKHLLKIVCLIAFVIIFVSSAFAGMKEVKSPVVYSSEAGYVYCFIRNIGVKNADIAIEACHQVHGCASHEWTLEPGELSGYSNSQGSGSYFCNFKFSNKQVALSMCGNFGCMLVPQKY